jgi:hypothetical protein
MMQSEENKLKLVGPICADIIWIKGFSILPASSSDKMTNWLRGYVSLEVALAAWTNYFIVDTCI